GPLARIVGRHQRIGSAHSPRGRPARRALGAGSGRCPKYQRIFALGKNLTSQQIRGIIPPLVTPLRPDGSIDEQAHRAEVRYMIDTAAVHGLAVCGSTGEGHTLTTEETRRIVAWTVDEARGRVPVIAGIIANSTQAVVERARAVADLGVAALQVTPVHYVFRPDDESMVRH